MAEDARGLNLCSVEEAIAAIGAGEMLILVDDADRENEGDIVVATELITAEQVSFMLNHARGLICCSISGERAQELDLPLQELHNNSAFNTPFAVSVDQREVVGSGVTAASRVKTLKSLVDIRSSASDLVSPGNVFPLIVNPAGVIGRNGQTEGSYDLARLAGLIPSGVICEILNPDGSMARGEQLNEFADKHGLKIVSIEQLIDYRINREILVREVERSVTTNRFGEFDVRVYKDDADGKEHLALIYGDLMQRDSVPVRIHSECLTGDVFGSARCDCGDQLAAAMDIITEAGCGVLLYLRQEGRGIGLGNKLRAYALQDQGADTVEANERLGFEADLRNFVVAARMLELLGVDSVRLITNNPQKIAALEGQGINISERIPVVTCPTEHSKAYLETKREKLGHLL